MVYQRSESKGYRCGRLSFKSSTQMKAQAAIMSLMSSINSVDSE